MIAPGIGTAIGAGVGAITGLVAGIFGGGAKRRAQEAAMRAALQAAQYTTMPSGMGGTIGPGSDIAGMMHGWWAPNMPPIIINLNALDTNGVRSAIPAISIELAKAIETGRAGPLTDTLARQISIP